MRRRELIQRIGAASTLAVGASGLATATAEYDLDDRLTHAKVENGRGELETLALSELDSRRDLPSPGDLSAVGGDVGTECCCYGCNAPCLCCPC